MFKYTLAVTSPEYWNTIHNSLIVDSNEDGIPDRKVTCSDVKEHSLTRGTYWLTAAEATGISTHPQVKWIELSPSDNPYSYPTPEPDTPVSGVALSNILPLLIVVSNCASSEELNITANCVECIVVPSLIASTFAVWKSLPFLMYTVYSTTLSLS